MTASIWKEREKETIGERLKRLRKDKRWSQTFLGGKINKDRGTVADIEDDNAQLSQNNILQLCKDFHCTADYLLCRSEMPTPEQTDVYRATGLSEESIRTLKALVQMKSGNEIEQRFSRQALNCLDSLISTLVTDGVPGSVLFDIADFIDADRFSEKDNNPVTVLNDSTGLFGQIPPEDLPYLLRESLKAKIFDKLKNINKKRGR